jgi:hypothetical protein
VTVVIGVVTVAVVLNGTVTVAVVIGVLAVTVTGGVRIGTLGRETVGTGSVEDSTDTDDGGAAAPPEPCVEGTRGPLVREPSAVVA